MSQQLCLLQWGWTVLQTCLLHCRKCKTAACLFVFCACVCRYAIHQCKIYICVHKIYTLLSYLATENVLILNWLILLRLRFWIRTENPTPRWPTCFLIFRWGSELICRNHSDWSVTTLLTLKVFQPFAMHLGSCLKDLGSKSPQYEMHIKATNVKGDSNVAAAVIHWLLCSYASASAGLSQYFPSSTDVKTRFHFAGLCAHMCVWEP